MSRIITRRSRRAAVMVLAAFLMIFMLAIVAFSVDTGYVLVKKAETQAAVDSSVLAGVNHIRAGEGQVTDVINNMLTANGIDLADNEDLEQTIEYGAWDPDTRTFASAGTSEANAIRLHVRNTNVPSFFGKILGQDFYTVEAQATAMKGTKRRDVAVVIDCSTSMSASMGNGVQRIENAKAAAQGLVDQLGDEDRVGLAVYSWSDTSRNRYEKTGHVETLFDYDKTATENVIDDLDDGYYTSGTNIAGGFRAGLDIFLNSSARPADETDPDDYEQVLVMLTDGRTNKPEPLPTPDDGATGTLPEGPYSSGVDSRESVRQWSNTIKARGILVYVITLGDSAYDTLMVEAASPTDGDREFYFHVADGDEDYQRLWQVFKSIGAGHDKAWLVE